MTQSYQEAIRLEGDGGIYTGEFDETWYQGRGGFGGVVAAVMLNGIEKTLGETALEVKSTQITFCAPLLAKPFQVEVETVRRGSSVINMLARVVQDEEIKSMMVAMMGRARTSGHDFQEVVAPKVPRPEDVPTVPFGPMFPAFAQHFEFKFAYGGIPYSGSEVASLGGWGRIKDEKEPLDYKQALALFDMWPPAIYSRLSKPTPAVTVSWQVVFTASLPRAEDEGGQFYLATLDSDQSHQGFMEERSSLYDEHGRCLARGLQSVAVF